MRSSASRPPPSAWSGRAVRLAAALGLALLAATNLPAEERPALRDYLPKAVAECGASPDWVELSPGEEVTLKPPQGADYE